MGIKVSNSDISGVYHGNDEISEIYKGTQLLYQNKPTKWLLVTPVLTTLSRATWNATTQYGDCTGAKEIYRDQTTYQVIRSANNMAGSDAAWYTADYTSTSYAEIRIYQSNVNSLIHHGPGIDFHTPMEVHGICIKVAGASRAVISSLCIAVRYSNGVCKILKTASSTFECVEKKMVYYFDKPTLISSVIITRSIVGNGPQAVSRCGIYLLTKGGNLDFSQIPGGEIN